MNLETICIAGILVSLVCAFVFWCCCRMAAWADSVRDDEVR